MSETVAMNSDRKEMYQIVVHMNIFTLTQNKPVVQHIYREINLLLT